MHRRWIYLISCAVILILEVGIPMLPAEATGSPLLGLLAFYFFWPGMMAAAVIFRGGIHSDYARAYLILAVITNALLWSWPIMRVVDQFRKEFAWPWSNQVKRD
jgi:hypothetical protein